MKRVLPCLLLLAFGATSAGPPSFNLAQYAYQLTDTPRTTFLRGSIPNDASQGLRELSYDTLISPYAVDMLFTNGNTPKRWLGQWDRGDQAEHRDIVFTQLANQADADTLFGGGWRFQSSTFGWGGLVSYGDREQDHSSNGSTTLEQDQSSVGLYGLLGWRLDDRLSLATSLYYQDLTDTFDDGFSLQDTDATSYRILTSLRYQPTDATYYNFWFAADSSDADDLNSSLGNPQSVETGKDSFGVGFRGVYAGAERDLEVGATYVYGDGGIDNNVYRQPSPTDEWRFVGDDISGSKAEAYARYRCHSGDSLDIFGGLRITGEKVESKVDLQLFQNQTPDQREISRYEHDTLTIAPSVAAVAHWNKFQLTLGAEYAWIQDEQDMGEQFQDAVGNPTGSNSEVWDETDSQTNYSASLSWLPNEKIRLDAGWAQHPTDRGIGGRPAEDFSRVSLGAWFFF